MANTAECLGAIHLCKVRITRLDQLGNAIAGPNNVYVSANPLMITVTPQIDAGQDKPLVGGCDCIVLMYRGYDKLKYFNLELDLGVFEPALLEMLIGAPAILDSLGNIIGWNWPNNLDCAATPQPNVCIEGWQDAWVDDHQDTVTPYVHWTWPSVHMMIGDHTLQNDFGQPKITGYTRGNPLWGLGPYGDTPQATGPLGGAFFTATIPPAAACGYQTHNIT